MTTSELITFYLRGGVKPDELHANMGSWNNAADARKLLEADVRYTKYMKEKERLAKAEAKKTGRGQKSEIVEGIAPSIPPQAPSANDTPEDPTPAPKAAKKKSASAKSED